MRRKTIFSWILAAMMFAAIFPEPAGAVSVSAASAILMEQSSGRVLFEKEAHEKRRIASITKIMTAVLAIESGQLEDTVKVSKRAAYSEGSSLYLMPGEKIELEDLVYGLMLRSGNDAATAIAEHVGGSVEGFVFLMNQKAAEIGMKDTVFSNPHGLDDHEEHYSTAYDMALLTRYAMQNEMYRRVSGTKRYVAKGGDSVRSWGNKNRLLTEKYKYCTGGKTGFTKRASRTLVTTATKNGIDLIAVTLNAPDDWNDHMGMFEGGFEKYSMVKVLDKGTVNGIRMKDGKTALIVKAPLYYPLTKEEKGQIRLEFKLLNRAENNKVAGKAIIYLQNKEIRSVPVYAAPVKKAGEEKRYWSTFTRIMTMYTGIKANG